MWGMARASAEGPITHRTMVTTPKSSTKVRRNSTALCQRVVRGETGLPCCRTERTSPRWCLWPLISSRLAASAATGQQGVREDPP